ncbi:MAG: DUF3298 and DUF4163 domain-containing protein [Paramuribaculum sp.]|nr:DUF3298 and DUF4163 domain-containing protein [Paramuribaculum sp.]
MTVSKSLFVVLCAGGVFSAALVSSCGGKGHPADVADSAFRAVSEVYTADRTYPGYNGVDSCSLSLRAQVEWPVEFGSADIEPLQAAIGELVFDNRGAGDVGAMLDSFLTATDDYGLDIDNKVVGAPASMNPVAAYERQLSVARVELNRDMVSYNIVDMSYMGGAHPNTYSRAFTYVFEPGEVLTADNLFAADSMSVVFAAVNRQAAYKFDVQPGELTKAGFFENAIGVSPLLSIQGGMVVFHYNPYEVAPYSFGAIDVAVAPWEIEQALTPLGKRLLCVKE